MGREAGEAGAARTAGRPPYRRILVPLDGSERAAEILADAAALARLTGGELLLAHVLPPAAADPPAILAHQAAALGRPRPPATLVMRRGDPAAELVAHAREAGADLIALATRGEWARPGVAATVAVAATIPVLVRRAPAAAHAAFVGPQRVLVPLDGSPGAEAALPPALALAAATGGSLLFVRAVGAAGEPERRAAHTYLAAIAATCRRPGLPVEATVRLGDPAHAIAWAALDAGADLVVVARERADGSGDVGPFARGLLRRLSGPLLLLVPAP